MRASFVIPLFLLSTLPVLAENPNTEIPPGRLYTEPGTGLLFGREINDLEIVDVTNYERDESGTSVRYEDPEGSGEKVDIYVYNGGLKEINDDNGQALSNRELEGTVDRVKELVESGDYRNVVVDTEVEIHNTEFEEMKVQFVSQGIDLEVRYSGPPEEYIPSRSSVSVGTYKDHFIKIRHTLPFSLGEERCREKRNAVIKSVISVIKEHTLRPKIEADLAAYAKDPISEEGMRAASGLFAYADASEIILVKISTDSLPWLEVEKAGYTEEEHDLISRHLMTAFIAGHVNSQLMKETSEVYPGILTQLNVYQRLRKERIIKTPVPVFEDWIKMKSAGTLKAHFEKLAARD